MKKQGIQTKKFPGWPGIDRTELTGFKTGLKKMEKQERKTRKKK